MRESLTIYFFCETYTGYRNYFMRRASAPQGLPPLYNTWNGYAERGHRVHIFTQDYMYDGYSKWMHDGKQLHNIPLPFKYLREKRHTLKGKILFRIARQFGLFRLWRYVTRLAREEPPDVIYSCSPWCSLIAWRKARRYNAVHVVRRFGTVLYENIQGKGMGLNESLRVEALFYRMPFDMLVMGNDGTYGDRVARHYGCPEDKLRFWTNGINKELYDPEYDRVAFRRRFGYSEDKPVILALSRMSSWKRIDRVLDVMRYVKEERPDARLLIVGEGEMEQEYKKIAISMAIDDVTHFVGPVEHRDVGDYFNGCDIYIQLFDITNRCNPLYEAMVCAMPVVTMDDPSIDDMVFHKKTGLRVGPTEMDRAAHHILELLENKGHCRELGDAAREHIVKKFQTWPERIDMEIKEVLDLVKGKQSLDKT